MIQYILAFIAGGVGTLVGGMEAFIIAGFVGMIGFILQLAGVDVTYYNTYAANLFFLPAVMFNGAGIATAYAALHHDVKGWQVTKTLAFTKDPLVLLVGCFGGLFGFIFYQLAAYLPFGVDQGAVSVIILALFGRFFLNKDRKMNRYNLEHLKDEKPSLWIYEILVAAGLSAASGYFCEVTGNYSLGFSVSAMFLLLGMIDPDFPATHQITMTAGYAMMVSHNIFIAIACGILAQIIFLLFVKVFNTDCGTHIDPPAVAIGFMSLIIFNVL